MPEIEPDLEQIPDEALDNLQHASNDSTKQLYNRDKMKKEIRRRLENLPLEDV